MRYRICKLINFTPICAKQKSCSSVSKQSTNFFFVIEEERNFDTLRFETLSKQLSPRSLNGFCRFFLNA